MAAGLLLRMAANHRVGDFIEVLPALPYKRVTATRPDPCAKLVCMQLHRWSLYPRCIDC